MSDSCLVALAKNADFFYNDQMFVKFLEPWYRVDQHRVEILACLKTYLAEKPFDKLKSTSNYSFVLGLDRKKA